ncbi:MAG: hypothetical protein ABSC11_05230 [Smithella sp.]|jgi:hypothetical protein
MVEAASTIANQMYFDLADDIKKDFVIFLPADGCADCSSFSYED